MPMRFLLLTLFAFAVPAAGASHAEIECKRLAGSEWKVLETPPANASELIQIGQVRNDVPIVWLEDSKHKLTACAFVQCGSVGTEFWVQDGQWTVRAHHTQMCSG